MTDIFSICNEIALRWIPQDFTDDRSIRVQVMASIALENFVQNKIVFIKYAFETVRNIGHFVQASIGLEDCWNSIHYSMI